jgi:glycosyltransferase involved in cell wall biosynthesis
LRVDVIVPVYNAADYVRKAVESALARPETVEVILVEDGSTDESLAVCQELAAEYPTVRLYRHPNGENRGAGASRNLAISESTRGHIAFLDADYFLPCRFSGARSCSGRF